MSSNVALQHEISTLLTSKMHLNIQSPTTDLLASGLLDSLGLVDLLVHMEQQFGVSLGIENFEIDDFRSVEAMASSLATKLPKRPS